MSLSVQNRLYTLRQQLDFLSVEAFLISNPENIFYISGFTSPDASLLISAEETWILTDSRYFEQAEIESPEFLLYPISHTMSVAQAELLNKKQFRRVAFEGTAISWEHYSQLISQSGCCQFISCNLDDLRLLKTAEEIILLKAAVSIADMAFSHVLQTIATGQTEEMVAWEIEQFMRTHGADRLSFETIVASGIRSALPHGRPTNKEIQAGDLVTLDFGAVHRKYCSDMTRTLVMGKPTNKQVEIYKIVLEAQLTAIAEIRPGQRGIDIDAIARNVISKAGYGSYFSHSLGHGVGLAIHENPRLSSRSEVILEPGMIVTVEPGIYIPGWGGIRIEDMVLVTPTGCEILTASDKRLIEIR